MCVAQGFVGNAAPPLGRSASPSPKCGTQNPHSPHNDSHAPERRPSARIHHTSKVAERGWWWVEEITSAIDERRGLQARAPCRARLWPRARGRRAASHCTATERSTHGRVWLSRATCQRAVHAQLETALAARARCSAVPPAPVVVSYTHGALAQITLPTQLCPNANTAPPVVRQCSSPYSCC